MGSETFDWSKAYLKVHTLYTYASNHLPANSWIVKFGQQSHLTIVKYIFDLSNSAGSSVYGMPPRVTTFEGIYFQPRPPNDAPKNLNCMKIKIFIQI
jgi:hypothetical protein